MDAILSDILTLLRGTEKPICLQSLDPKMTSVGHSCFSSTFRYNNRNIGSLFWKYVTTTSTAVPNWSGFVDFLNLGKKMIIFPTNAFLITSKESVFQNHTYILSC